MAKVKALKIEKAVFVLPDTFAGTISDALRLMAAYIDRREGNHIEGPADPRMSTRRATLEVLEGGGRLTAVMNLFHLDVPEHLAKARPNEPKVLVVPSIVVPGG